MFTVEEIITLSGRTSEKILESRANTDLIFPSFFVRLLRILVQFLNSNGGAGTLQFT